jgi:hypothetical protein
MIHNLLFSKAIEMVKKFPVSRMDKLQKKAQSCGIIILVKHLVI